MITVIWSGPAEQDLRQLSRDVADRVSEAIHHYAVTGQGDLRRLTGRPGEFRLRVGDWRVRLGIESSGLVIYRVLHRREAYRD